MHAGEVVEEVRIDDVLVRPRHPYSSGMLRSLPALTARKTTLPAIPGRVPSRGEMPDGCRFRPRCAAPQPLDRLLPSGHVRCCRRDEITLPGVFA